MYIHKTPDEDEEKVTAIFQQTIFTSNEVYSDRHEAGGQYEWCRY